MSTVRRPRSRPEQVRDLIMMCTLIIWLAFASVSVGQLFTQGSRAIDSLLPFWFWGIPIAPYTALYAPWKLPGSGGDPPKPEAAP